MNWPRSFATPCTDLALEAKPATAWKGHRDDQHRTRYAASRGNIEPRALVFIVVAGAAVIALTLRTWADFSVAHLRGTDADVMTAVGDGYFVIALAIVAIVCAGILYLRPILWAWLLPAIGIAALAAYQAGTPWYAAGTDTSGTFVTSSHATAAVYEVFALATAIGLVAAVLASLQYRRLRRESIETLCDTL